MRVSCFRLGVAAVGISFSAAVFPAPTLATQDEGMLLLQSASVAGNQLTYKGVFVYRRGDREETSRIAHSADGGRQRERIEVLDGSPREVVRDGQEVRCYLPDEKLLIIENQSRRRNFPAVLPSGRADLADMYRVRKGQAGRVAGINSRAVLLEPRDAYRYGHELWVDPVSGMLLKASLIGDRGEVLESFAFTQLRIGGALDRGELAPKFRQDQVTVRKADTNDIREEDIPWTFRNLPPGFSRSYAMRRPVAEGREGLHVVFSDGLAAMSVFIEPAASASEDGVTRVGPVHVFRRQIDGYQAVVMGEVPVLAVRRLGEGIERRLK